MKRKRETKGRNTYKKIKNGYNKDNKYWKVCEK